MNRSFKVAIVAIIVIAAVSIGLMAYIRSMAFYSLNPSDYQPRKNLTFENSSQVTTPTLPTSNKNISFTQNHTTTTSMNNTSTQKTISVINDPSSKSVLPSFTRILLNGAVSGMTIDPIAHKIYAVSHGNSMGHLFVIDSLTNKILSNVSFGFYPYSIAMNHHNGLLYVTDADSHNVIVMDSNTGTVLGNITIGSGLTAPSGIAINEKTNTLYIVNYNDNYLYVVDGRTNNVVRMIPNVHSGPGGISDVVDEDTNMIYAADLATGLYAINGTSNWVTEFVKEPSAVIAMNHALNKLYLEPDGVATFDIKSNKIVSDSAVYYGFVDMALDEKRDLVYLTSQYYQSLTVYNGSSNKVVAVIPVGVEPDSIVEDSDSGTVYIGESNSIDVIPAELIQSYAAPSISAPSYSNLTVYAVLSNGSSVTGLDVSLLKNGKVTDTEKTPALFHLENGQMYQLTSSSSVHRSLFENSTNYIHGGWYEAREYDSRYIIITSNTKIHSMYYADVHRAFQNTIELGVGETDGYITVKNVSASGIEATFPAGCSPIPMGPYKITLGVGESKSNYWDYNATLVRIDGNNAVLSTHFIPNKVCNMVCIVNGIYTRMLGNSTISN